MTKNLFFILLAMFILFTIVYDPKKTTIQPQTPKSSEKVAIILGDKSGKKNAINITTKDSKLKMDKPLTEVKITNNGSLTKPKQITKEQLNQNFSDVINAIPKKMFVTNIFFKKATTPTKEYTLKIFQLKHEIKLREPAEVDIIGYSDTKGEKKQNLLISKKRAEYIKKLLEKYTKNINIYAFGESHQLVKTKDNVSQQKNRRVEVIVK